MKKNEVIKLLVEDATERGLANIDIRYETVPAYFGNEAILPLGYALVEVEEGILKVPYYSAEALDGYERFAYEEADIATEEEVKKLVENLESQLKNIRALAQKGKAIPLDINENRPVLLNELQELQANLEDLSERDLLDCREVMLYRVNRCLKAIGETDEDNL